MQFDDESQLRPVGTACFQAGDDARPEPANAYAVQQGYQEGSNVNTVEELFSIISVRRLYEANVKMAKVQDERMQNLLRAATQ